MGSVTSVLSSTGEVLERRSYDAFGQVTYMLPDGTPVATSPTGLKVGFHGQLLDQFTGMYQMGYRWYSPVLGRWASRDPVGLAGGSNPYVMAGNSPATATDVYGLWQVTISGGDGFGGYLSLGYNSGQFNLSVRVGAGVGISGGYTSKDLGGQPEGLKGVFPSLAASGGTGLLGAAVEVSMVIPDGPNVAISAGPLNNRLSVAAGIDLTGKRDRCFYADIDPVSISNNGFSAFAGIGFTFVSKQDGD